MESKLADSRPSIELAFSTVKSLQVASSVTNDKSSPNFDRKQGDKTQRTTPQKKLSCSDVSPKEQMLLHANLKVVSVALPQKQLHV